MGNDYQFQFQAFSVKKRLISAVLTDPISVNFELVFSASASFSQDFSWANSNFSLTFRASFWRVLEALELERLVGRVGRDLEKPGNQVSQGSRSRDLGLTRVHRH